MSGKSVVEAPTEMNPGKSHAYLNEVAKTSTEDVYGMATAPQSFKVPSPRPPGKLDDYFDPWENPERDYVNFPRIYRRDEPPPRRHAIFPESYFKWIEAKTGVTGPYVIPFAVATFLMSKELVVVDHQTVLLLYGTIFFWAIGRVAGPGITEYFHERQKDREHQLDNLLKFEKNYYELEIAEELKEQETMASFEEVIASKKEAVELQLETAYRERIHAAHSMIKKKLDYQVELLNVMRKAEQKHMVDWIISNVRKSITAKQEEEALRKCIADLKALAKQ